MTPTYQAEDWDYDGYDDNTGEWIGDSYYDPTYDPTYDVGSYDSDEDGIDDIEEEFGFEITVTYEDYYYYTDYDPVTGEEFEVAEAMSYSGTIWIQTDPADPDSDDDGYPDGYERDSGFHPMDPADGRRDSDLDLLTDGEEYLEGTKRFDPDSDDDGFSDFEEVVLLFTNPNDPSDPPPVEENHEDGSTSSSAEVGTESGGGMDGESGTTTGSVGSGSDGSTETMDGTPNDSGMEDTGGTTGELVPVTPLTLWQRIYKIDPAEMEMDHDLDGLSSDQEFLLKTHPRLVDSDRDGLTDGEEVNGQVSIFADESSGPVFEEVTVEETDPVTGETFSSTEMVEVFPAPVILTSDPLSPDTDGDRYSDLWEITHGFTPSDSSDLASWDEYSLPESIQSRQPYLTDYGDEDSDGITNAAEFYYRTDPFQSDTDGDGRSDEEEVFQYDSYQESGYWDEQSYEYYDETTGESYLENSPVWVDTGSTVNYATSAFESDTDNDGLPDGYEITMGLDPTNSFDGLTRDEDGDGIPVGIEYRMSSSDLLANGDSDEDGISDHDEWVVLAPVMEAMGFIADPVWDIVDGTADYDGDGRSNAHEWAAGTDMFVVDEEVVEEDVESETQETSNGDSAGESTGTNESDSSSTSGGGMEGTQIDDGVGTETGEVPGNETPSGSGGETQEAPENEATVLDSELFLEFRVMDLSAKEDLQEVSEEGTGLAGSGTFLSQYDFVQDSGDEPLSISAEFENLDSAIGSLLPSAARFSSDAKWWVSGFDFETENVLWQKYAWSVHYGQAAWGERQEIRLVRKKGGQYEPIPINHPDIVRKYLAVERSRPLGSSDTDGPHVKVESVSLKTLRIRSGQAKSVADGQEPRDGTQVPGNPDEAAENLILDARVLENREVWVDLLPVEIVPDDSMYESSPELSLGGAGVIGMMAQSIGVAIGQVGKLGDVVPSVLETDNDPNTTGVKHFVSPKKTDDIDDEHVILKAEGITAEQFTKMELEWEGGEAHQEANKVKINRNTAGKTEVRIKTKDGTVVDEMFVWIVWGEGRFIQKPSPGQVVSDTWPTLGGQNASARALDVDKPWNMIFSMEPLSLFTTSDDIPDLRGATDSELHGEHPILKEGGNADLEDGATMYWDVSRQFREKIANPNQIPRSTFPSGYGDLFKNQPKVSDTPIDFPAEDWIGNDDSKVIDEINLPYEVRTLAMSGQGDFTKEIGELASRDGPSLLMTVDGMSIGDVYGEEVSFREFVRVKVGDRWYRVSDFLEFSMDMIIEKSEDGTIKVHSQSVEPSE